MIRIQRPATTYDRRQHNVQLARLVLSVVLLSLIGQSGDLAAGTPLLLAGHAFDPVVEGIPDPLRDSPAVPDLWLVQLRDEPTDQQRAALKARGFEVLGYVHHHALLGVADDQCRSVIDTLPFVRWSGPLPAAAVTARGTKTGVLGWNALVARSRAEAAEIALRGLGAAVTGRRAGALNGTVVLSLQGSVPDGTPIPGLIWLEAMPTELGLGGELSASVAFGNLGSAGHQPGHAERLKALGYDGRGVTWSVFDTGVDIDHPQLRVVGGQNIEPCVTDPPGDDPIGWHHGTLVASVLAGRGNPADVDSEGFQYGLGMAPGASLFSQNGYCEPSGLALPGEDGGWDVFTSAAVAAGASGMNCSWYYGTDQLYGIHEQEWDRLVRDGDPNTPGHQPLTAVFNADNRGPDPSTVNRPKHAKNLIVVGGSNSGRDGSMEDLYEYTSHGPASDGRVLPTLVAPGAHLDVTAARPPEGCDKTFYCGFTIPDNDSMYVLFGATSAATPHVSGAAAILTEWWRDVHGSDPSPALLRALLVAGAKPLAGVGSEVPDNAQGWGRLDLMASLAPGAARTVRDQQVLLNDTGDTWTVELDVAEPDQPVKVTLAWTDAPALPGVSTVLVNDLDLEVRTGERHFVGGHRAGAITAVDGQPDRLHNLERVVINSPGDTIEVTVQGSRIAGDGVPGSGDDTDQDFALVVENAVSTDERTLVVPAVAHVTGLAGTEWRSELELINTCSEPMTVQVSLLVRDRDNSDPEEVQIQLAPGETRRFADVLTDLFDTTGAAALWLEADRDGLIAFSRTFNLGEMGTFGQSVPAVPLARAVGWLDRARLMQLESSSDPESGFRSNIGFVNLQQRDTIVRVEVSDASGALLGQLNVPLPPRGHVQLSDALSQMGVSEINEATATVWPVDASDRILTYASVVDNRTGDPTLVTPARRIARTAYLAAAAHSEGLGGTQWRTDIEVANVDVRSADVQVDLLSGRAETVHLELAAGSSVRLRDVLVSTFSVEGVDAVAIDGGGELLSVSSRTFNLGSDGTFGQLVPPTLQRHGIESGERVVLGLMSRSADPTTGYRSNLGLVHLGNGELEAVVQLMEAGTVLMELPVSLGPWERLQLTDVFSHAGDIDVDVGGAEVQVDRGTGTLVVYASVVDNRTGDPIYVEGVQK